MQNSAGRAPIFGPSQFTWIGSYVYTCSVQFQHRHFITIEPES